MSFRRSVPIVILIVGAASIWGILSKPDGDDHRFEAHEFALFRSEYETLKDQKPETRVEHFRDLLDVTESAHLTPGMTETLTDFCRKVAYSEEEAPSVQAEARLVLHSLEANAPGRAPASVDHEK